jgi:PAS domain S-box-containing protein
VAVERATVEGEQRSRSRTRPPADAESMAREVASTESGSPDAAEDGREPGLSAAAAVDAALAAATVPARKRWEKLSGLVFVACVVLLLEVLRVRGLVVSPAPFLLVTVVYAAFAGGLGYGLLTAAVSAAYAAYAPSGPGALMRDGADDVPSIVALAIVAPGMALLVDRLRRGLDGLLARERAARAAAEAAEARLRTFVASVNEVVFTLDSNRRFTMVLGRGLEPFGMRPEMLIGRHIGDVMAGMEDAGAFDGAVEQALRGSPASFDHTWETPDGLRYFHTTLAPIRERDGTIKSVAGVTREVTERKRAEEVLRASEARYRLLAEHASDMISRHDPDGIFLYASPACQTLLGYTPAELVGLSLARLCHPEDLRRLARVRAVLAGTRESRTATFRLRRSSGDYVWVETTARAVRSEETGQVLEILAVTRDVTARLQAEENARRLIREQAARAVAEAAARRSAFLAEASRALYSSLDMETTLRMLVEVAVPKLADWAVVYLVNEAGEVERAAAAHVDPARAPLLDRLRSKPLSRDPLHPVLRVLESGMPELVPEVTEEVLRSAAWDEDHLAMLHELGPRSFMAVPLWVGTRRVGALSLNLSGDERRFGPEDLSLAEDLARLAGVAVEHARLYLEAQEANRAKSDFLAVMSHELRTPLNAITGYADLLLMGLPQPLGGQPRAYVERIRNAAWHLFQLIEEILTFARLEAAREVVTPERFDIGPFLRDCAALIEPIARDRGLDFRCELPPAGLMVRTDARKLRQVLLNLLSNAVKFTDRGGVVLSAKIEGEWGVFRVTDTGQGIAPEHAAWVFEPFWQAEQPATRRVGGTGLGLAVARRLARLLGGDIEMESEPGRGTTFTARIPVAP